MPMAIVVVHNRASIRGSGQLWPQGLFTNYFYPRDVRDKKYLACGSAPTPTRALGVGLLVWQPEPGLKREVNNYSVLMKTYYHHGQYL